MPSTPETPTPHTAPPPEQRHAPITGEDPPEPHVEPPTQLIQPPNTPPQAATKPGPVPPPAPANTAPQAQEPKKNIFRRFLGSKAVQNFIDAGPIGGAIQFHADFTRKPVAPIAPGALPRPTRTDKQKAADSERWGHETAVAVANARLRKEEQARQYQRAKEMQADARRGGTKQEQTKLSPEEKRELIERKKKDPDSAVLFDPDSLFALHSQIQQELAEQEAVHLEAANRRRQEIGFPPYPRLHKSARDNLAEAIGDRQTRNYVGYDADDSLIQALTLERQRIVRDRERQARLASGEVVRDDDIWQYVLEYVAGEHSAERDADGKPVIRPQMSSERLTDKLLDRYGIIAAKAGAKGMPIKEAREGTTPAAQALWKEAREQYGWQGKRQHKHLVDEGVVKPERTVVLSDGTTVHYDSHVQPDALQAARDKLAAKKAAATNPAPPSTPPATP